MPFRVCVKVYYYRSRNDYLNAARRTPRITFIRHDATPAKSKLTPYARQVHTFSVWVALGVPIRISRTREIGA